MFKVLSRTLKSSFVYKFTNFVADLVNVFTANGAPGVNNQYYLHLEHKNDVLALLYGDGLVILAHSEIDVARKIHILEYSTLNNLVVNLKKKKLKSCSSAKVVFRNLVIFCVSHFLN